MGAAFLVPLAISAVGAGIEAVNRNNALSRANTSETQGIIQQQMLQQQAAGQVNKTVNQIQNSNPTGTSAKSTGDFIRQLRTNQANAGLNSGAPPVAGANKRYGTSLASGNQTVQNYGNAQAADMGATTGAVQQRMNEGNDMSQLGASLGLLGAQSGADSFVNQLRTAAAGQESPWATLGGQLLTNGGLGMAASGAFAPPPPNSLAGTPWGQTGPNRPSAQGTPFAPFSG